MNNTMEYKGYVGSVEFSEEDGLFYGKVMGIRALISYEGTTAHELIDDFPIAESRSAVIEMSLYAFIDRASILSSAGLGWDDLFIYKMIERRCKLNAKKESTN